MGLFALRAEGSAEPVTGLDGLRDARAVLREQLTTGRDQPNLPAVQDSDRSSLAGAADHLAGGADGEVGGALHLLESSR